MFTGRPLDRGEIAYTYLQTVLKEAAFQISVLKDRCCYSSMEIKDLQNKLAEAQRSYQSVLSQKHKKTFLLILSCLSAAFLGATFILLLVFSFILSSLPSPLFWLAPVIGSLGVCLSNLLRIRNILKDRE